MRSGLRAVMARLPTLAALTLIWLLAAASLTFAAAGGKVAPVKKPKPPPPPPPKQAAQVRTVVVPDVRRQPYVFAKGILDDAGFAWRVRGDVEGYASNIVVLQVPDAGARIVGEGTPTVTLMLERNPDYEERGVPENSSRYEGTEAVAVGGQEAPAVSGPAEPTTKVPRQPVQEPPQQPEPKASQQPEEASATQPKEAGAKGLKTAKEQAPAEPGASRVTPFAEPKVPTTKPPPKKADPLTETERRLKERPPAFEAPDAPPEPLDEMPLPERAEMIGERFAEADWPDQELIDWWLYQHAWVVTGAKFGWNSGADALEILIEVDKSLYERFGFGLKSAALAQNALDEVERLEKG